MQPIEWKEPPPEAFMTAAASFYFDVAKAVRRRPMQWALLPREFASADSAKNAAMSIRTGKIKTMPKGAFEAVAHDKVVYLRYLGDDEGNPPEPRDDDDDHDGDEDDSKAYEAVRVRNWAKENAIEVSKHGRLPQHLIDRYHEAQRELADT